MDPLPTPRKQGRPRGRPIGRQPAARAQILDALTNLLDQAPLVRPSLRAVAQAAEVTPALLHYHFSDLQGLLACLVAERAQPLLMPLLQELQSERNAAAALARFLPKWTALTLRHRWLVACLLQTPPASTATLTPLGGQLRKVVAEAQRQSSVRRDLPDHYIALLLLCLGAMPHLAQTALGEGLAVNQPDAESAAELTLQHLSVLRTGVASTYSPRQDSAS
jgi:AcrR family transcriptional regulator